MSEIQLPGLATGIDTGAIIKQFMEVNRRRMYSLEVNKEYQEGKYDIMTDLQTKLKSYSMAVENLADSSDLRGFAVSTSDSDFLTASANSNASEGNHAIQVKQLATSELWVHDGYKYSTSFVGAGNFIFSYDNQELVVQTTATTTLDDLVGLINNDAGRIHSRHSPGFAGFNDHAGILGYFHFHTRAHQRRFSLQQRHRLALHV